VPGQPHIHVVALPQVDLSGAAGTFRDDQVEPGGEVVERCVRRGGEVTPAVDEVARGDLARGPAHHDDVAALVAAGLEQHRVHRGLGLGARRERLHPLRAADLGSVDGDHRVV